MRYIDYYGILGVSRNATMPEIKNAFRKLARRYHPDVSRDKDAEHRMKDVNEAYTVLSDPEKRAAYDHLGEVPHSQADFHPPPHWEAGFEFSGAADTGPVQDEYSDFFSQLFAHLGTRPADGRRAFRGPDHHATILLDLNDAYTGAVRELTLRAPVLDGDGHVRVRQRHLRVRIPRGVREGQFIRLAGQGAPSKSAGPPGDLLLEVHFRPHPQLRVDGRDLYLSLRLSPWEAALGADIPVALPGGEVTVHVPAGVSADQPLRIRGKGLPGDPPGDLWVQPHIVVPPVTSATARALWANMAREIRFDPRAGE